MEKIIRTVPGKCRKKREKARLTLNDNPEIDLKNPSSNHHNAGFSDQERNKMTELLSHGYIDTFRYLYPDKKDAYTWWSYMFKSRERNAGWRIDYFIVSDSLKERIKESLIYSDILGSDHCPIGLEME